MTNSLSLNSEVWAYIRCSSDEQADKGLSVAGQRQAIIDYALQHGLAVSRFYIDEGLSGTTDEREQFQLMIADAAHERPAIILLWSWSRFARNENDAMFYKAWLRRQGIEITTIQDDIPHVDGFETIIESLIHWRDAQKSRQISADSRRGQQTLARMGYVPSGGPPPRGYRVEIEEREIEGKTRALRRWVPDPELWPLARKAWEMRLRGASYRQIIQETGLYKSPGCLSTFFSNTAYKGELWFGGTLIELEPVVSPEEWERVQTMKHTRHPRRVASQHLLSGLLKCARCGRSLVGRHTPATVRNDGYRRKEFRYYVCSRRENRHECSLPRLNARELEAAVVNFVMDDVLTEESLARYLDRIASEIEAERPALEARLSVLRREQQEVQGRISRLLDALETVGGSQVVQRLKERQAKLAALEIQTSELETRLAGLDEAATQANLRELRERLTRALAKGPPQEARQALASLIEEIVVDEQELRVRYRYPFVAATRV